MRVVLKVPECAVCKHCSDILYDEDMGPFTFVCASKETKHNMLCMYCAFYDRPIKKVWCYFDSDGPFHYIEDAK